MKHFFIRILSSLILLIALFLVPWWLWLILCAISAFVFPYQYELLVLGFIADSAYGIPGSAQTSGIFSMLTSQFLFLSIITVLLIVAIILKPQIKFYTKLSL